jgi:hypothetical protein
MAGPVYHSDILPGNTNNDNSLAMAVIYIIAAYSSLIMEAKTYEYKRF